MQNPPGNLEQIVLDDFTQNTMLNARNSFFQGNYYLNLLYSLTENEMESETFQRFLR